MIALTSVSKRFDDVWAVNKVSLTMEEGKVTGIIGTNGAGKTTLLRMVAGIMKPDEGHIFIDDKPVFDNENAIKDVYFIPDEPFFFRNANGKDMEKYLKTVYEKTKDMSVQKEQSKKLQQQVIDRYEQYSEAIARAYTNAEGRD